MKGEMMKMTNIPQNINQALQKFTLEINKILGK